MRKLKVVLLIILAVVLADFAFENAQPAPAIKLFKFQLGELPSFLLTYLSLAVGVVIGWVAHGLRLRRKRRGAQAAPAALAQQQQQESQAGQDARQAQ
jgi:uncharacterized integral membrane protein